MAESQLARHKAGYSVLKQQVNKLEMYFKMYEKQANIMVSLNPTDSAVKRT